MMTKKQRAERLADIIRRLRPHLPNSQDDWVVFLNERIEKMEDEGTGRFCKRCGSELIIKYSKLTGKKFFGCSQWLRCEARAIGIYVYDLLDDEEMEFYQAWQKEFNRRQDEAIKERRKIKAKERREEKKRQEQGEKNEIDSTLRSVTDLEIKNYMGNINNFFNEKYWMDFTRWFDKTRREVGGNA